MIKAATISEAVKQFHEQFPDCDQADLKCVLNDHEYEFPWVYSKKTRERIYYIPGCVYGYTDCIFDSMRKVAKVCDHQSDLAGDKQKPAVIMIRTTTTAAMTMNINNLPMVSGNVIIR